MKRSLLLSCFALPSLLLAQEAAAPGRLQVAPAAAVEPEVTLIPEEIPRRSQPTPAPEPKDEKKSKTEENAEDLQTRIHFLEARVKALRDPQVQAEWERAGKAKTDLEKREALKRYYTLLYSRILKLDPSVKKVSELRKVAALRRLEQTRIDPTEPLDRQERDDRFSGGE